MKTLKALGKRLLFPPLPVALPVIALGAALLTYVFVAGLADTPLAYAAYTLSFFNLSSAKLQNISFILYTLRGGKRAGVPRRPSARCGGFIYRLSHTGKGAHTHV